MTAGRARCHFDRCWFSEHKTKERQDILLNAALGEYVLRSEALVRLLEKEQVEPSTECSPENGGDPEEPELL